MAEQPIQTTPMRGIMDRLAGMVADRVAPAVLRQVSEAFTGSGYFGPGQPLTPREPAGADPRMWQYPPGLNIVTQPRTYEPVTFETLQSLADNCDMVRICIEMRKDQIVGLDWTITPREGEEGDYPTEIAAARKFFERPDGENSWDAWLRELLEDVLVLDALSIYKRRARSGQLYALEVIDGSTIKPLLDAQGRTPAPPLPAYQQILFGYPYADLTADQLLYRPKNRRPRSAYGSSPVEWILLTVNSYLRRQIFNLSYYTEGNIPEGFGTMPEGWTPDQIRQFQEWFDAVLAGSAGQQRRIRFVGSGFDLKGQRQMNFEVQLEEWLARVITAAFQVSYHRFVQRVVRATAEAAAAEQADMGLDPLKRFISGIVDMVLAVDLGVPFLRHEFLGGEKADEKIQAEKRVTYVAAGIMTRDEVREAEGLDPLGLPLTSAPTVTTPAGPVPLDSPQPQITQITQIGQKPGGGTASESVESAKSAVTQDLARWRRKALKAFREGKAERAVAFESAVIPPGMRAAIAQRLADAKRESDVVAAFEVAARPFLERPNARTAEPSSDRETGRGPAHAGPVRATRCADHVPYP